ncbi:hypothetical protein ACIQU6_21285 [Streptomyces sp. NPDC090442]
MATRSTLVRRGGREMTGAGRPGVDEVTDHAVDHVVDHATGVARDGYWTG